MLAVIIRTERLDDVIGTLEAISIDKLTVSEVTGVGRTLTTQRAFLQESRLAQLPPRRESEIAVASERVPQVIAAIRAAAATDKPRDGKIFVAELEGLVCIRSRESGVKSTLARAASSCHTRTAADVNRLGW